MAPAPSRRPSWALHLVVAVGVTVVTAGRVRRRRQARDDHRPAHFVYRWVLRHRYDAERRWQPA